MRAVAVSLIALALGAAGCGRTDRVVVPERGEFFELLVSTLPQARVGEAYDVPLGVLAVPAALRLDWRVVSGDVPRGLVVLPDDPTRGRLVGVPMVAGTFAFRLEVFDPIGRVDARGVEIEVLPRQGALRIETDRVAGGFLGTSYEQRFVATGGSGGYRWSIPAGDVPPGVTLDAASGLLFGTPTAAGLFNFAVEVRDEAGGRVARSYAMEVVGETEPLRIVTAELPSGALGRPYEARVVAEGGARPYRWLDFGLPDGLELFDAGDGTVLITGWPQVVGVYAVDLEVRGDLGQSDTRRYELAITSDAPPLRISTRGLPAGRVGEVYAAPIEAAGGSPPYRWSVVQGSLPSGTFLGSTGTPATELRGTPQQAERATFVVQVTDQDGAAATLTYVVDVEPAILPLQITTATLPDGLQGGYYEISIEASGGLPPYGWRILSGAPPDQLILEPVGTPSARLSGVITEAGAFTFEVEVADTRGVTAVRELTMEAAPAPLPLRIITPSLPAGHSCSAYAEQIEAQGGWPPYSWSIQSGALPSGLGLGATPAPVVSISGYPTVAGAATFRVSVTDALGQMASQAYTLSVGAETQPRWVALVGRLDTSSRDVYVSDICSGAPTPAVRLSGQVGALYNNKVAFSSDGSKLAFIGDYVRSGVQELYIVGFSGATRTPPTRVHAAGSLGRDVSDFAFSPDGRKLAFAGDLVINGRTQVSVVDVSDPSMPGTPVVVSRPPAADNRVLDLAWSGDSQWLAYRGNFEDPTRFDVYVASAGAANAHVRVNAAPTHAADAVEVVWSPVGASLGFTGDFDADGQTDLYWTSVSAGATPTPVRVSTLPPTGDVRTGRTSFSPDGRWLTFTANVNGQADELFGVLVGASMMQQRLHPAFASTRDVVGVSWSPTEARLVYVADQDQENINEAYLVDLRGSTPSAPVKLNLPMSASADVRTGPTNLDWTASGEQVAFLVADFNAAPAEVYVSDVTGATPVTAAVGPVRTNPSLDARGIFFSRRTNKIAVVGDLLTLGVTEIFFVDPAALTSSPTRLNPMLVSGGDVKWTQGAAALRPDGSGVFYIADQVTGFLDEAWSVNVLDGVVGHSRRMHSLLGTNRRVELILVP